MYSSVATMKTILSDVAIHRTLLTTINLLKSTDFLHIILYTRKVHSKLMNSFDLIVQHRILFQHRITRWMQKQPFSWHPWIFEIWKQSFSDRYFFRWIFREPENSCWSCVNDFKFRLEPTKFYCYYILNWNCCCKVNITKNFRNYFIYELIRNVRFDFDSNRTVAYLIESSCDIIHNTFLCSYNYTVAHEFYSRTIFISKIVQSIHSNGNKQEKKFALSFQLHGEDRKYVRIHSKWHPWWFFFVLSFLNYRFE